MRLGWMIANIMSALVLLTIIIHIFIQTFKAGVIDWVGIAVLVLGILSGLTGMGFAKAQQKRYENKQYSQDHLDP